MAQQWKSRYTAIGVVAGLILLAMNSYGQQRQDHSCTVDAAGSWVIPKGPDGRNFERGWGLQAGIGVGHPSGEGPGFGYFVTANYMYEQLTARPAALAAAKMADPTDLANATSAHGSFSAVTIDPTLRYAVNRRLSFYGSGGFGWFHRGVAFNGANPGTLLQSSSVSLARRSSDSGAYDVGGGANFGLKRNGGLMVFAEMRLYHGTAINSGTKLLPVSVGLRW